jgi:D-glycero-D-manno-heptose 1,7-bisphosphate phosphatase
VTGGDRRAAVFLDRDGVLNELVMRDGVPVSPRRAEDFVITAGAAVAVGRLREAGFAVFVVSNQPDLARGLLERREHDRMMAFLRTVIPLDDVACCPHDDRDQCSCRKPQPGMLLDLAERHGVDLRRSVLVGDSSKDMEAGRRAGCRTILLSRDYNAGATADAVLGTLADAVAWVLRNREPGGRHVV